MKIVPYKDILNVPFGSTEATVRDILGNPEREDQSGAGSKELVYADKVFRFRPEDGTLHEVTLNSEYLNLEGEELGFAILGFFIAKNDPESFETSGFLVSPKYGLAFDPHHQYFLTAFCEADLEKWRD